MPPKKFFTTGYFLYAAGLLIILNCNPGIKEKAVINGRPEVCISLKTNDTIRIKKFNDLFSNTQIFPLRIPDSLFISSVTKVILCDQKIFLLDKKFSSLMCFDKNGHFLRRYGRIGLGFNEFKKIDDFDVDSLNNTMVVLSNEDLSLYFFKTDDASFLGKQFTGFFGSAISILPDKKILLYTNYKINKKAYGYNVLLLDSSGRLVNKFFPFDPGRSSVGWRFTGFMCNSNGKTFFDDAFGDTVYMYENKAFIPYSYIDINSDLIRINRYDHAAIYHSNIIPDPNTSFLRNIFFKNNDYIIFGFQAERRLKTCFYKIKDHSLSIPDPKIDTDPLIALVRDPLWLGSDNKVVFSISAEDVLDLKEKTPELLNKLASGNRKQIDSATSGFCLLVADLKM